jgi:hypothetical protein
VRAQALRIDMAAVRAVVDSNPDIAQSKCACVLSKSFGQHVCWHCPALTMVVDKLSVMFKTQVVTGLHDGTILDGMMEKYPTP